MKFAHENLINLWQKFIGAISSNTPSKKTLADYNREALVRQGADQFKKLTEKGLNLPIAHL